jgi:hypothetical protein
VSGLTKFGKQILGTARDLGVNNAAVRRKRKHYLLTGQNGGGISVRMYFATTPGDVRAARNIEAEIRRQLEGKRE